jgi:hypothetical protein
MKVKKWNRKERKGIERKEKKRRIIKRKYYNLKRR